MFNEYLKKILPIPIVDIEVSKLNDYKYRITTYGSVVDERGTRNTIDTILKNNKRIKSFDGWYFKKNAPFLQQMVIEFVKTSPLLRQ